MTDVRERDRGCPPSREGLLAAGRRRPCARSRSRRLALVLLAADPRGRAGSARFAGPFRPDLHGAPGRRHDPDAAGFARSVREGEMALVPDEGAGGGRPARPPAEADARRRAAPADARRGLGRPLPRRRPALPDGHRPGDGDDARGPVVRPGQPGDPAREPARADPDPAGRDRRGRLAAGARPDRAAHHRRSSGWPTAIV